MSQRNSGGDVTLTVVIPAFDEVGNIGPLHDEVRLALDPLDLTYELLVVDDGSTDGTFDMLLRRAASDPRLRVIRLAGRHGQTAALQAGFDHARGRLIATMDGDLQNDPRDLPRMIDVLDEGYDAVAGWRRYRRDPLFHRRAPSWLANLLVRWLTGYRFRDLGCGIKVFRRDTAERLRLTSDLHRFIPVVMAFDGARCTEVEVRHRQRTWGRSKYGLERTWQVLLDLVLVLSMARSRRLEERASTRRIAEHHETATETEAPTPTTSDPLATGSWMRHKVDHFTASTAHPLSFFGRIGIILGAVGVGMAGLATFTERQLPATGFYILFAGGLAVGVLGMLVFGLGLAGELARSRRHRKPQYTISTILDPQKTQTHQETMT